MRIKELLSEALWRERHTAAEAIRRNPGSWIHFSKMPKLGVNARMGVPTDRLSPEEQKTQKGRESFHKDPPGVYFYKADWLLGDDASESQYANSLPYFWVVRLRPSRTAINLGTLKAAQADKIAQANGWFDDLERIRQDPSVLSRLHYTVDKKLVRKPGGLFYMAMDYLVNVEKKFRWLQMLRGVDALIDTGFGIINENEPAQAVVFNPRLIEVLEHGDNKDTGDQLYFRVFQDLATEFGGRAYWKDGHMHVAVSINGCPIEGRIQGGAFYVSYFKAGFWTTEKQRFHFEDAYEGVVQQIRYAIEKAANEAQPDGLKLTWTEDRVKEVFDLAVSQYFGFTGRVRNNEMVYVAREVGNNPYSRFVVSVRPDDTIEVYGGFMLGNYQPDRDQHASADVTLTFGPDATPPQVAKAVLDALAQQVRTGPKFRHYWLGALTKATGFNFTDYTFTTETAMEFRARKAAKEAGHAD